MHSRQFSFLPNTKLGITLAPGSCEVQSVKMGEAAYWAGVVPTWIITSIDGFPVNPTTARHMLKEIKTNKKRVRPYKVIFEKPDVLEEKRSEIPVLATSSSVPYRRSKAELFRDLKGSRSLSLNYLRPKGRTKIERRVAGNERVLKFLSSTYLGFSLKEGTTIVEAVRRAGAAASAGVKSGWKVTEICGDRVNYKNVKRKLRDAKEREHVLTIRFETPSQHALLYKLKKILTKPISDMSMNMKNSKEGRADSEVAHLWSTDQMLFFPKVSDHVGSDKF